MRYLLLLNRVWKRRKETVILAGEAEAVEQFWRSLLKIFSCSHFGLSELKKVFTARKERGRERQKRKEGKFESQRGSGGGEEKKEKENSRLPSSDPAMENVIAGPCLPGLDDGPGCQRPSQGTSEVLDVLTSIISF